MKKIFVLCEGATEEEFVRNVLDRHLWGFKKTAVPIVVVTKEVKRGPNFTGGITGYAHVRRDLQPLLHDPSACLITTLIDFYGLPADFPGMASARTFSTGPRSRHLPRARIWQ